MNPKADSREPVLANSGAAFDIRVAGAVLGGVLVVFGSFLEWAVVSAGPISLEIPGTDGLGFVTAAAGAAIVLVGMLRIWALSLIGAIAAGGIAAYDISQIAFYGSTEADYRCPSAHRST